MAIYLELLVRDRLNVSWSLCWRQYSACCILTVSTDQRLTGNWGTSTLLDSVSFRAKLGVSPIPISKLANCYAYFIAYLICRCLHLIMIKASFNSICYFYDHYRRWKSGLFWLLPCSQGVATAGSSTYLFWQIFPDTRPKRFISASVHKTRDLLLVR